MSSDPLCRYLEWDSEFFGLRIARLATDPLRAGEMEQVLASCKAQKIDCLYFLADSADTPSTRVAEDNDFRLVDVRVSLERDLVAGIIPENSSVRNATGEDLPSLRRIARDSFHDTRFYHDGNFTPSQCDALYETWVEASCNGFADAVLVVDVADEPAGFVTCKMVGSKAGEIGLLGVSSARQGIGVGRSLVEASLSWFDDHGARRVTVVTQGRNVPAQRLYQRCGFVTLNTQLWYHRWFC
jgi:dTDP-4-amino-4,6-dideoxy-D-galactose acyltransferase